MGRLKHLPGVYRGQDKAGADRVSYLTYKNSQCLGKEAPVPHLRPFRQSACPYQIRPSNPSQSSTSETSSLFLPL